MHEISIAHTIVETLLRIAAEHRAPHVVSAKLKVGEFTHIDPETLTFAFEAACRGTILEGCRLDIERVPTRVRCPECGWEGPLSPEEYFCPACGRFGFTVIQGREIQLLSMDIPDGEPPHPGGNPTPYGTEPCTK